MAIEQEDFIQRFPKLYHISLASSLESIHRHGLLSTTAILDKFEVSGERRRLLETRRRAKCEPLTHHQHGEICLNDQVPLYEGGLKNCLLDMSIEEWCLNLNNRVFFWPTLSRFKSLAHSKLGSSYKRIVISIESRALLELYGDRVELSCINSGNATRRPAPRGKHTFAPLSEYQHKKVAEVTAPYAVTDVNFKIENLLSE